AFSAIFVSSMYRRSSDAASSAIMAIRFSYAWFTFPVSDNASSERNRGSGVIRVAPYLLLWDFFIALSCISLAHLEYWTIRAACPCQASAPFLRCTVAFGLLRGLSCSASRHGCEMWRTGT